MLKDEFVNPEKKQEYKFKIGKTRATALTGFIIGFLASAIVLVPIIIWLSSQ